MPIPFTAIVEYSRIYEIDDDDFYYVIRELDDLYLQLNADKSKSNSAAKKGDKDGGSESNKVNPSKD